MLIHVAAIASGTDASARAVPPMIRRRLAPIGRMALGVLSSLAPDSETPMVFASSWSDASKGAELLMQAIGESAVSPMGFSGSVHNAIGATASIWLKNRLAYRSVSAGAETTEAGLLEAAMALAEHESVLFVRYEDAPPSLYSNLDIADLPGEPYAWGLRLVRDPGDGIRTVRIERTGEGASKRDAAEELAFLTDAARTSLQHGPWLWEKVP